MENLLCKEHLYPFFLKGVIYKKERVFKTVAEENINMLTLYKYFEEYHGIMPIDLRIGNYLDYEGNIIAITNIDYEGIKILGKIVPFSEFKGVEINQYWLDKLGIEKKYEGSNNKANCEPYTLELLLKGEFVKKIKYVHELQNYHYEMFKEELIIKN